MSDKPDALAVLVIGVVVALVAGAAKADVPRDLATLTQIVDQQTPQIAALSAGVGAMASRASDLTDAVAQASLTAIPLRNPQRLPNVTH